MTLAAKLSETRDLINQELGALLPVPTGREARLIDAMRYSAIGTGKALRPFLALTVGDMLNLNRQMALRIGVAIEMLHTYSLIHDDLPAMDNDTLRRGKPTNHIQFDEATAILAGDALQARAFEILSESETSPDGTVRADLVQALAHAAGMQGMVAGQMLDLIGETQPLNLEEIEQMQGNKTGALLRFSCVAPAIAARSDETVVQALDAYARAIGLLFQITDDILDVVGDTNTVGKTLGKDATAHKSTFVSLLGLEKARALVASLSDRARAALEPFGERADILRQVITFMVERKR